MGLLTGKELRQAELLSRLTVTNPFLPERVAIESELLAGQRRKTQGAGWSRTAGPEGDGNAPLILAPTRQLATAVQGRLIAGQRGSRRELELYGDLVLHLLFLETSQRWYADGSTRGAEFARAWPDFRDAARRFWTAGGIGPPPPGALDHLFAGVCQVHRAFHQIFSSVLGRSAAAARLRAAIWQSVFTHDLRRYRESLYLRMAEFSTLVTGPSGSGKELVAAAIGRSLYCPFDGRKGEFIAAPEGTFHPLHLAALPANLVESELFGHARGAFTGAIRDRAGWLETTGPHGAVFLDEVGEIDLSLQVKLLRVLQQRSFSRVGEQVPRRFEGKLIAATNRDLQAGIAAGWFREDLYYRLCGDVIRTPSLRELLSGEPRELEHFVRFIVGQLVPDAHGDLLADVLSWTEKHVPEDYPWPGNFRELEQCVRNLIVHHHYDLGRQPPVAESSAAGQGGWLHRTAEDMAGLKVAAADLMARYCTWAYWKTGSYEAAGESLQLDRRTLRARIDARLLKQLRGEGEVGRLRRRPRR